MNLEPRPIPLPPVAPPQGPADRHAKDKTVAQLRTLAVIVITRNEAAHIGRCLEAICAAVRPFADTRVIVVDSDSEDETAAIAATYPVQVYRYRSPRKTAAAGRAIGTLLVRARYILFVDGDSFIEPEWLAKAVAHLDAHPGAGLVYGQRREVLEGVDADFTTHVPDTPGLGGTALYRSAALAVAGGFHPHLTSDEEAELRARIERRGYIVHEMPDLMFTHHTVPKDSWRGYAHRIRRSMFSGSGQVLRAALYEGLLPHHLRRLNRPLLVATYLLTGLACLAAVLAGAPATLPLAWAGIGAGAFGLLWYRRGDFSAALYIVMDWLLNALGLAAGFLADLPQRGEFAPVVERLRRSRKRPRSAHWEHVPWRA